MPYTIRKLRHPTKRRSCNQVYNTQNKRVFSKCTTPAKARRQLRLLRAITYNNFKPTRPRKTKRITRRKNT